MAARTQTLTWIAGALVALVSAVVSVAFPALAPILAAILLGAGWHYRRSPETRALGSALLVSGVGLLLLIAVVAAGLATGEHSVISTGSQIP